MSPASGGLQKGFLLNVLPFEARALYAWTAQDSDEHSVAEGEVVELTDQGMTCEYSPLSNFVALP